MQIRGGLPKALSVAQGRGRQPIEVCEGGAHAPSAREAGVIGDRRDGKVGLIEKAFGALNAQRQGHLQR